MISSNYKIVRNSVKENTLSHPILVTDKDCKQFIIGSGKVCICEVDDTIVDFAIADLKENNNWALFLDPSALVRVSRNVRLDKPQVLK